jgi:hypothetical protein
MSSGLQNEVFVRPSTSTDLITNIFSFLCENLVNKGVNGSTASAG